jgi:hypothetical protein
MKTWEQMLAERIQSMSKPVALPQTQDSQATVQAQTMQNFFPASSAGKTANQPKPQQPTQPGQENFQDIRSMLQNGQQPQQGQQYQMPAEEDENFARMIGGLA